MKPAPQVPAPFTISRPVRKVPDLASDAVPSRLEASCRSALIDGLKARIRAIERSPDGIAPPGCPSWPDATQKDVPADGCDTPVASLSHQELSQPSPLSLSPPSLGRSPKSLKPAEHAWTFGAPQIDAWLPDGALDPSAVHEAKPAAVRDWGAAAGFVLRLARRRLRGTHRGPIVWCAPARAAHENGRLSAAGLMQLGIDPHSFLLVETAKDTDTLWAMEESLRSGAAALVIGVLGTVQQTPARRLALAAAASQTPVLLLTSPSTAGTGALATRWQIGAAPSAHHVFDSRAPGACRIRLMLTRCRGSFGPPADQPSLVEWSDDAHCFRVVSALADAAARPACSPGHHAASPWRNAG